VLPEQYLPERIGSADVQDLLQRVEVRPDPELSARFPAEHSARVRVHLRDGSVLERAKRDYHGFHTNPMSWEAARAKFDGLAAPAADADLRDRIAGAVRRLDTIDAAELTRLLERAATPSRREGEHHGDD
jgi:2-methylcitrate dehydratase